MREQTMTILTIDTFAVSAIGLSLSQLFEWKTRKEIIIRLSGKHENSIWLTSAKSRRMANSWLQKHAHSSISSLMLIQFERKYVHLTICLHFGIFQKYFWQEKIRSEFHEFTVYLVLQEDKIIHIY